MPTGARPDARDCGRLGQTAVVRPSTDDPQQIAPTVRAEAEVALTGRAPQPASAGRRPCGLQDAVLTPQPCQFHVGVEIADVT